MTITNAVADYWTVDPHEVNPEHLACPVCCEVVRPEPPGYWRVADGLPRPEVSHQDGSALCRVRGRVTEPVEVEPQR